MQGVLQIDGIEGSQARQQTAFGCRDAALGGGCKGRRLGCERRAVMAISLRKSWSGRGGGGSRGGVPASPSPASAMSAASCGSGTLRGGGEVLLHPSCGIGMCGLDGGGELQWWPRWC